MTESAKDSKIEFSPSYNNSSHWIIELDNENSTNQIFASSNYIQSLITKRRIEINRTSFEDCKG